MITQQNIQGEESTSAGPSAVTDPHPLCVLLVEDDRSLRRYL
jgi:hypothetical protein